MTEAQLAAFNELAAAAKQEDEAQRAYEETNTALELASAVLDGARIERHRAQEKSFSVGSTPESGPGSGLKPDSAHWLLPEPALRQPDENCPNPVIAPGCIGMSAGHEKSVSRAIRLWRSPDVDCKKWCGPTFQCSFKPAVPLP